MPEIVLLLAVGVACWREWRREPEGLGKVPPRPYRAGGTFWHRGRQCCATHDPELIRRVQAARDTMREWS